MIAVIGFVAGTLTTLAFVPQVIRSWRTRSTADLSGGMLTTFIAGVVLWIVYGVATGQWPLVAANVATLLLAGVLAALKLRESAGRS